MNGMRYGSELEPKILGYVKTSDPGKSSRKSPKNPRENCGPRRHPPSLKSPNAILELSDANFARIFGVISTDGGHEESMFSPSRDEYGKGL